MVLLQKDFQNQEWTKTFLLNSPHTVPLKSKLLAMAVLTKHGNWEKNSSELFTSFSIHTLESEGGGWRIHVCDIVSFIMVSQLVPCMDLISSSPEQTHTSGCQETIRTALCATLSCLPRMLVKVSSFKRIYIHVSTYILLLGHSFVPQIFHWVIYYMLGTGDRGVNNIYRCL